MGIHNPHDLATRAGTEFIVDYYPQDLGRGGQGAKWKVCRLGFKTDPMAPWYEHGNKAFYPHGPLNKRNKDSCRDVALAWASREYNIKEWERSPFGSYHPKGTLAAIETSERG